MMPRSLLCILALCYIINKYLVIAIHVAYDNSARNIRNIESVFFEHIKNWNRVVEAPAVGINQTVSNGFCLVSTQAFKHGEIVLSEIPVVSWCYDPKFTRCSHCHSLLKKVSVCCEHCQEKYCSSNCLQHAVAYHKPLCALSKSVTGSGNNAPIHKQIQKIATTKYSENREDGFICLIMRLYALAYSRGLSDVLTIPGVAVLESKASPSTSSKLTHFIKEIDHLFMDKLGNIYSNANSPQRPSDNISVLYHLQYILQHYAILTYQGLNGLYLSAGFMNHDCSPNVEIVLDPDTFKPGHVMKIRAIKDIKRNEELTISYIDPSDSYRNRQRDLIKEYHFSCKCSRCISENPNIENNQIKSSRLRSLRQIRRADI